MTSKPTAGIQRQPQRSLGGTSIIQRPVHQRSLSQQYSISTPIRKTEIVTDTASNNSHNRRYGSSKLGGSRLKVELSKGSTDVSVLLGHPKYVSAVSNPVAVRGRPRLYIEEETQPFRVVLDSTNSSSIRGVANITAACSIPMPRRPVQKTPPFAAGGRKPIVIAAKKEARPKPYVLEVPLTAPHFQSKDKTGYVDFFPWAGDHSEDQFNDHVIRQGFFDKSQTTQNETGSARLSIFPSAKHKSGLQSLSSLFTTVLSQRRAHGQITSAPTFKPPPRVTLTDTKRETWLRDLANTCIPLRRLSRTIPHGIRGKVLLEQCLSKQIPTERAVWLAKCVGANEIRAFKRKGITGAFAMGGEAKWIRDWTVFVEQFIESIIASCGENDWRTKVLYAIRLGAHLYSEHLLDREHYMDWLSLSLESCSLAKAPIWLLLTQVYWTDLLSFRKFGRRIVAAMCAHLHTARKNPDQDLLLPLTVRMTSLLKGLAVTHSENFISPKLWAKYDSVLVAYIFPDHEPQSSIYRSILRRNAQISAPRTQSILHPRRILISQLDKTLFQPYSTDLPQECRRLVADLPVLARTVLEWCISPHRPGPTKVYVAARLLRVWSRSNMDITETVLGFLGTNTQTSGMCKYSLYHLICELTRSGHFIISKYIQWLIARGGIRSPAELIEDGPCATRLLAELPIHEIPDNIESLRQTMLTRASTSLHSELQETRAQITILEEKLSAAANLSEQGLGLEYVLKVGQYDVGRSSLSRAVKSEIGIWVRRRVRSCLISRVTAPQRDRREGKLSNDELIISLNEFILIRWVLEEIEDFSMLADVLKMVAHSRNLQILASVSDTVCLHMEVFAAIGALHDLFEMLLTRLRSSPDDCDVAGFQRSLFYLAGRLPGGETVAMQLSTELFQSNQRTAIDACSPVSDHMPEILDNSESQFFDEFEKVMASGTSMELTTLKHLFNLITTKIEASWSNGALQMSNCAVLLRRLRCYGVKHFDFLMVVWLDKILQTSNRPSLVSVLAHLISADCIGFREVLAVIATFLDGNSVLKNHSNASSVAVETLALLLGTSDEMDIMTFIDHYHLSTRRLIMEYAHPNEVLSVIRRAIEFSIPAAESDTGLLRLLCRSKQICMLLQRTVLCDSDVVVRELIVPLSKSPFPKNREQLDELIKRLLEPYGDENILEDDVVRRVEHTLRLADDLTLPFCQLELQLILAMEPPELSVDENDPPEQFKALERAIDSAIVSDNNSWTSIIPSLNVQIAHYLCQRAERQFLQLVPTARVDDSITTTLVENKILAKRYLFIVDATSYSMQATRASYLVSQIMEKLNDIWQIISNGERLVRASIIDVWLPLLLDFIILHVDIIDISKTSSELRSRMLLTLTAVLLELQKYLNANSVLFQHVFDVSILLVDDISEEARLNCIKSLKDKTYDTRVRYIFGYSMPSMDWMQLSQKGKLMSYPFKRWEILSEPTPNVGENDTSLSLTLFGGRKE